MNRLTKAGCLLMASLCAVNLAACRQNKETTETIQETIFVTEETINTEQSAIESTTANPTEESLKKEDSGTIEKLNNFNGLTIPSIEEMISNVEQKYGKLEKFAENKKTLFGKSLENENAYYNSKEVKYYLPENEMLIIQTLENCDKEVLCADFTITTKAEGDNERANEILTLMIGDELTNNFPEEEMNPTETNDFYYEQYSLRDRFKTEPSQFYRYSIRWNNTSISDYDSYGILSSVNNENTKFDDSHQTSESKEVYQEMKTMFPLFVDEEENQYKNICREWFDQNPKDEALIISKEYEMDKRDEMEKESVYYESAAFNDTERYMIMANASTNAKDNTCFYQVVLVTKQEYIEELRKIENMEAFAKALVPFIPKETEFKETQSGYEDDGEKYVIEFENDSPEMIVITIQAAM